MTQRLRRQSLWGRIKSPSVQFDRYHNITKFVLQIRKFWVAVVVKDQAG